MTRKLRKHLILIIPIIAIIIIAFSRSFATLTENTSIEIESSNADYGNNDSGSWRIEEDGYWDFMERLNISVNLNSNDLAVSSEPVDYLFLLDMSSSMYYNEDLRTYANTIFTMVDYKLRQNADNNVAVLYYNEEVWKYTGFVHDLNYPDMDSGYIAPYDNVDYPNLFNYIYNLLGSRNIGNPNPLNVIIISDSLSGESSNTLYALSQDLRVYFPYVSSINGISFNTNGYKLRDLDVMCDNTYIADSGSDLVELLDEVLFKEIYDDFVIKEYINSNEFDIENDSIDASIGDVSIDGNILTWDLSGVYKAGTEATLNYNLVINQANSNSFKMFSAHTKHEVTSSIDNVDEDVTSNDTIVLDNNYKVNFLPNAPSGCNVTNMPSSEKHHVLSPFRITASEPKCEGYKFKGWKVDTTTGSEFDAYYYFNNTVYMPPNDMYLSATWSKLNITKSESGNITSLLSLYDTIASRSTLDTPLNFSNSNPSAPGRIYEMSSTANDEYPVYYYRGDVEDNNILMGGMCWKIIRTTSTGGIKLIYNGAAHNGNCVSNDFATTSIGETPFITNDGFFESLEQNPILATHVGYMYDDTTYGWGMIGDSSEKDYSLALNSYNPDDIYNSERLFYFASSVNYDDATNKYTLVSPQLTTAATTYGDLDGKYICKDSGVYTCSTIRYFKKHDYLDNELMRGLYEYVYNSNNYNGNYTVQTFDFKNGATKNSSSIQYVYGKGYQYSNGEYHLTNTMSVSIVDFFETDFTGYYYSCLNSSDHCSTLYYIPSISLSSEWVTNYVFLDESSEIAQKFNEDYPDGIEEYSPAEQMKIFSKYMNFNHLEFVIIIAWGYSNAPVYVGTTLTNGATVNDVLSAMSTSNNTYSSDLKDTLESWFYSVYTGNELDAQSKAYLETSAGKEYAYSMFSDYLEDTVFCNDRSISTPNNYKALNFGPKTRQNSPSVACSNLADRFTMLSTNGNGKLLFPIGAITKDELTLTDWPEYADSTFWTMSPASSDASFLQLYASSGHQVLPYVPLDVKPVISLKAGIKTSGGNGSAEDPYVILIQNGG